MAHYLQGLFSLLGYVVLAVAIAIPLLAVFSALGDGADSHRNSSRPVDREERK